MVWVANSVLFFLVSFFFLSTLKAMRFSVGKRRERQEYKTPVHTKLVPGSFPYYSITKPLQPRVIGIFSLRDCDGLVSKC